MHLKYAEMLAIFVHHNMKLGDNTPEWWEALTSKHEISEKKISNCGPNFTALQYINNLETQRWYETTADLENFKFLKKIDWAVQKLFAYLFKCLQNR